MARTTPFPSEKAYREAVRDAAQAAAAYYDSDTLLVDDATYDALVRRIEATEAAHPAWRQAAGVGFDTARVGAGVAAGGSVVHAIPMLSLENAMDGDELRSWFERFSAVAAGAALCVEPKLDGLAVSAMYDGGALVRVATRGDGTAGEDVTGRCTTVHGLPTSISLEGRVEVRGEVYMSDVDFAAANELRTSRGREAFKNPRNAAAGVLRNTHDDQQYPLSFAAYDLVGADQHRSAMSALEAAGVATARRAASMPACVYTSIDAIEQAIADLGARRADLGFSIDGAVVKADDSATRRRAGATAKAPRWAVAYKYPADARTTTVLGITVQVGRTGVLTPVAELAPVEVGGTTIRRATLSNPSEVARKDVRVGDTVWVRRAGEVIPEIVAVDLHARPATSTAWVPPTVCPQCGGPIDQQSKRWRCENRSCGIVEALVFFAGRGGMDIDGLGDKIVERLVEAGTVSRPSDLYHLRVDDLLDIERMGEQSARALVARIAASTSRDTAAVICALGIGMVGTKLARNLAAVYPTLAALRQVDAAGLANVDGVGPARIERIVADVARLDDEIGRLLAVGVGTTAAVHSTPARTGLLAGKTVVITGSIPGHDRRSAEALAVSCGAKVSGSVSTNTDYLIVGDGGGSKRAKAEGLGVAIMDAATFLAEAGH